VVPVIEKRGGSGKEQRIIQLHKKNKKYAKERDKKGEKG